METFAREHKQEIRKDPEFRRHFQEMCSSIGVDPLASGKGFWSNMLDIGDFYYELGVQIVEVCMASAHKTGGLMELGELRQKLIRARSAAIFVVTPKINLPPRGRGSHHQDITEDDLLRATKKLRVLGTGFTVIPLDSGRYLVQVINGTSSLTGVIDKESFFSVRSWRGEPRSSGSAPSSRAGVALHTALILHDRTPCSWQRVRAW